LKRFPNSLLLGSILVVFMVASLSTVGNASAEGTITKTKSGLVNSDPMTTGNMTEWAFSGTASIHNYYEDSQGLHLGVQSPQSGQWVNYYATNVQRNAFLYHAQVNNPYNDVPDGVFDVGLYVEGSNYTPYVSCETYSDGTGYYWIVGQSSNAGASYNILYSSPVSSMPHTQDCTIITNGNNYLKVYIGGKAVYSSSSLSLGMPTPLIPYFQDDSSSSSAMHYAIFSNYYATSGEKIKVTNNPANAATVSLVNSSGQVLASSAVSSGTAELDVGSYIFPLSATINVYDANNNVLASSPETIYGGDEFSVSSSGTASPPQPPTGLSATAVSDSQIALGWSAPSNNGGSPITGYEIERSADSGSTWSQVVANTGNNSTSFSDGGLAPGTTYTYRVSAINSAGTSGPSNSASAATASPNGGISMGGVQSTSGTLSSSPYQLTVPSFSIGSGPDRLLLVGISANNNNVASVTYGGIPLRQAASSFYNNDAEFWYLKDPNGTGNVVVTMAGATSAVAGAYAFSGVNQTDPIPGHVVGHSTANSSPSITITTAYQNSWVVDLPSIYGGVTLSSPTCTPRWDANIPNAVTGSSSTDVVSSAGAATCKWTASGGGDQWDDIALELRPDSGQTQAPTVPGSPTGLAATMISSSEIDLAWTAPSNDGGSAIAGYMVERSANGGSSWSTVAADTGTGTTAYQDKGLLPATAYTYRVSAINAVGTGIPSTPASATTGPDDISLAKHGLIISDSLENETETQQQLQANHGYWIYGGDAPNENAPYDFFRDAKGLHMGVKAPQDGTWAGYYAESQNTTGLLFHAIVTTPLSTVSNTTNPEWYENGLYVQRAALPVNYVTCFSISGAWGIQWVVASVTGNDQQAVNETALWVDNSTSQPTTRDCTIITNGTNYLKVYLDGNMVYESNKLNLQMPEPFNSYLEPQSSYAGALLNGTYADYYATTGENVTVRGLPASAARVDLVDSNGNVLATAPALSGAATMDVGQFDFPIAAGIRAYDSSNDTVATTAGTQQVYGGDVYAAR